MSHSNSPIHLTWQDMAPLYFMTGTFKNSRTVCREEALRIRFSWITRLSARCRCELCKESCRRRCVDLVLSYCRPGVLVCAGWMARRMKNSGSHMVCGLISRFSSTQGIRALTCMLMERSQIHLTEGEPTVQNNDNLTLFDASGKPITNGKGKDLDNTHLPRAPCFLRGLVSIGM